MNGPLLVPRRPGAPASAPGGSPGRIRPGPAGRAWRTAPASRAGALLGGGAQAARRALELGRADLEVDRSGGHVEAMTSPSRTRPSGPPTAASGAACSTTVPKLVPLIRESVTRTMSVTPARTSRAGIGIMPHSGMPGTPTGPQPASTSTGPRRDRQRRVVDPGQHVVVAAEHDGRPAVAQQLRRRRRGLDHRAVRRQRAAHHAERAALAQRRARRPDRARRAGQRPSMTSPMRRPADRERAGLAAGRRARAAASARRRPCRSPASGPTRTARRRPAPEPSRRAGRCPPAGTARLPGPPSPPGE